MSLQAGMSWATFWTAMAALAASASVFVAAIYTYLTHRLVRLNAEPKVILYTRHDRERSGILMIVIENVGRDIAQDVRFTADREIPSRAFGASLETAGPAERMQSGPLIDGIPALGPGATREITWGQFGGLSKALGGTPIWVAIRYRHGSRQLLDSAVLEVASYEGTDASRVATSEIARGVEVMAKELGQISRSLSEVVAHLPDRPPAA